MSDLLVFTDTDCIPVPSWLAEIAGAADKLSGVFLVVGEVILFPRSEVFNCYELYDKCAFLNQRQYAEQKTGATANLTVSRLGFEKAGGFPEVFSGGDRVFSSAVMEIADAEFVFSEAAMVFHPARSTKKEIVKKLRRLGHGKAGLLYEPGRPIGNLRCLFIQTLGFVLLPHQWRLILRMFRDYGFRDFRAWVFVPLAWLFGWTQRGALISRLVALMRGQSSLPND